MSTLLEEETKESLTDGDRELVHIMCDVCWPTPDLQFALCGKDVSGEPEYEPGVYPDDCLVCHDIMQLGYCEKCKTVWDPSL